jgi:hypothetical protein
MNISDKCPPGKYFVVENDKIVCRECQIGRYSNTEMVETCTVCPDDKTTQAVGTKSAGMCICKLIIKNTIIIVNFKSAFMYILILCCKLKSLKAFLFVM